MTHIPNFFDPNDELSNMLKKFDDMLKNHQNTYFDVEVFSDIIYYLIETNQKEKAYQAIKIAKKQHPESDEIKLKEAQLDIIAEKPEKAKRILKELLKFNQNNAEIYYYFGKLYLLSNKMTKAIRYYDSAVSLSEIDERFSILYLITDDLMDKGECSSAINYLHQVLDLDKFDFEALLDLGTCYKELNQLEKAIEEFDKYLDRDPFNEMIWYQMGSYYDQLGEDEKAISAYEFAAALEPEYASAYFNLALLYSRKKNYTGAVKYLGLLLEQEPNNLHARFYLAESYYQLGKIELAMENYEKTLAISPDFADAWFSIGEIYYDEDKIAESLFYVRKAIKNDPEEPLYWHRLGMIQQNLKFLDYAIKSFQRVLKLDPYDEQAAIHLAECYFEVKDFHRVIESCKNALKTFRDPALYFLWGGALLELEERKKGLDQIEAGLKKDYSAFDNFVYFFPKILSFDAVKKLYNRYQGI